MQKVDSLFVVKPRDMLVTLYGQTQSQAYFQVKWKDLHNSRNSL